MLISDVLRGKGREVVAVRTSDKVSVAVQHLSEKRIGAVVVEERLKPVGIFSERDLVNALARRGARVLDHEVRELMTSPFISAAPGDRADAALGLMTVRRRRESSLWDLPAWHGRNGIAPQHNVPVGPGALVHDAWRSMFECLAEIARFKVAPDDRKLLNRGVSHGVGQEPDGFRYGPLRGLKPHHTGSHPQQLGVGGQWSHELFGLCLSAVSFGR